jgi:hypothetical protein
MGTTNPNTMMALTGVCRQLRKEVKTFIVKHTTLETSSMLHLSWFVAAHPNFGESVRSLTIGGECQDPLPRRKRWFRVLLPRLPNLKFLRLECVKGDHAYQVEDRVPTNQRVVHFCKVELQLMEFIMDKSGLDTAMAIDEGAEGIAFGRRKDITSYLAASRPMSSYPTRIVDVASELEPLWF